MALNSYDLLARKLYDADSEINAPDQGACGDLDDYLRGVRLLNQEQVKLLSDLAAQEIQALHLLQHEWLNPQSPVVTAYLVVMNSAIEG